MDIDSQSVQNTDNKQTMSTEIAQEQLQYIQKMINLLSKIQVDKEKGINVLPTQDLIVKS